MLHSSWEELRSLLVASGFENSSTMTKSCLLQFVLAFMQFARAFFFVSFRRRWLS